MEDAAAEDQKQQQQPPKQKRERTIAEVAAAASDDDEDMEEAGDGAAGASAQTPASAGGAGGSNAAAAAAAAETTGTAGNKKTPVERPTREDPAAVEKLRAYVASLGGTLGPGWMGVYKMRVGGSTAGQYDLYYRSPEGRMIRSRAEVLRILGLDPSGGAGGSGAAKKAASAGGKGSKKKGATAQQQADEGGTPAAGAAGAAAAGATPGGAGAGGSKWTLPVELPREDAAKAAKERAAELGLKPPFTTNRGVTILSLGTFHKASGYYDATHIWPLGYRAAWVPPHDPTAAAAAVPAKKAKKDAKDAADKASDKGASDAVAEPAADGATEQEAKADAEQEPKAAEAEVAAEAPATAAAGLPPPPPYRFISEIRTDTGKSVTGGEGPAFAVLLEPNPDAPAAADGGSAAAAAAEPLLVHTAAAPDVAWSAVADLQVSAAALVKRAKPSGAGAQPTAMQRALAAMPSVGKVWGMDCFGLSDVRVLQLLEALPGVDAAEEYLYVQQRNSWDLEASSIATKRSVVLSAAPNRRAAAAATKQRKRQQQLSMEAFVDRPPASPKADGASEQQPAGAGAGAAWDGLEDLAAAAAAATDGGAGKKLAAKSKGEGKGGRMTREDIEIRGVLDRLVERVSLVMAEPDEKERQKMLKAMEKADRAAARRREKTAEKAAEKAAGTPAAGDKEKDKEKEEKKEKEKEKKENKKEKEKKEQEKKEKPPKARAAKDKDKDAEAAPDVAAVVAVLQLPGNQVDERALPTAEVPAPPGVPLQLSYPVTAAGDAAIGEAGAASAAAASLSTEEVQQLLAVYQFLWDHRKLLGMEGRVPSLADLLAVVSESPTRLPAPARRAADEVHLALVRLLVGEALDELFEYVAESSNLGRRDISPAVPPITAATWPELARRYLAAAAAARYLATSEPRSSSLVPLQLPGQLQNLEPADWLHYLLAGLNFPHLLSRIALLPHASSRWAADALLAADDARARAAAERALQGVKSFDLQHLDGEGQVRRGRRLLHALLSLPEGGEQLGFYAPEFGEVVRAPRGLDLHMVAARLDAGLYQSTGDWLQALATDVRSSLALWRAALKGPKGKDIPGHQDARPALADEAERKLNELLADPDTTLALPAPRAPPSVDDAAAAAGKADGDSEMQDADGAGGSGGKGAGKAGSGKSRKSRSSRSRKQQEAGEEEEDDDPCSLDDPTRLFNPRAGCRVCWLDADKNRILLCDGCDGEYHCYCVEPPLLEVPEGAWFCPSCTARGLGLPKAEDESEDLMDVDAGGERRSTPRATTPSRAAAGGASISPSDDSAPGRTPCSPAFQHCHSHSHLVSDLHERAAARRPQPHGAAVAASAAEAPALPAEPSGSGMAGAVVGEAPLSLPPDVPEGPRVTLRANSRPGLQELAGLLRLAHLLGNYDYATGGPACASTAAASAGGGAADEGWTPSRRLALLSALCELAMDTNALRNSLDEIVETRKKARVEANAIRSKARQIQEEQAAAKKATVEKENAPKPEGDADANAAAGAAAAGKGGKGSKGGKGGAKDAKAGKGGKADKGAEASGKEVGEEGADEEGSTQEAKQDGKEATAAKSSRGSRRPTDLSVLPEAELKRLMSLEAQVEGLAVRQEALGEDRHGSRYWWLGADPVNPQGPQGVVLVELLPPGHAAAEQARTSRAFGEREAARRKEEKEEQTRKARREEERKKRVGAGEEEEEGEEEEPELDEWGLPKERQRQRAVPIGVDAAPGRSWAVFHSADRLNDLIGWLTPKGLREGPLRTALLRARDRIVASQAPAAAGDKQKQPAAAAAATAAPREMDQQQQSAPSAAEGSSDQPPAAVSVPPPPLLCPCVTVAAAGARRGGAAARQASVALPDAEDANGVVVAVEPAEAVALRTELLALHRGLPIEAFSRFWGSPARQEQWCAFVGSATSPQQVCAAVTVLEAMLVDEAFRPHWRLYCMPAQHPDLCTTWAAAWYRLGGLQGAIRKQIIPQRELHHQAAAAAEAAAGGRGCGGKGAAGKKDKGGAAAKQAQAVAATTERYTSRRGGATVPALPDISNVRSREAAALLSSHGVTGGKGQKDAGGRGQKRQRSADEDEEEEEATENAAADRKRGKRAATAAAKDRSRRPAAGGRGRGGKPKKEESEGEVAAEEEEEEEDQDAADDEEAAGSDAEASASGLEDEEESEEEEEDEEEDADSSDEEGGGRKRKSRPSRASARLQKKGEKSAPMTRRSSRLRKVDTDDEDESSSSGEEEEDARPAKRTRGTTAAAKASTAERNKGGRLRGAAAAAAESEDEEGSDSESEGRAAPAKGAQGRTRAGGSEAAAVATNKQHANGAKPAIGSRAAAILANRKRALADWSEESEDEEDDDKHSGGSGGESSSEEDEPAAAATGKKRGGAAAAAPATVAAGKRGSGRQQQQQQAAARKPPPRRMARSEVEYDVEDFDDLNT